MRLGQIINQLIRPFGYTVSKIPSRIPLPEMKTPAMVDRLRNELAATVVEILSSYLPDHGPYELSAVRAEVDAFYLMFGERPVTDNRGGSGFQNCFWVYMISRHFAPNYIVESGVWRGQSSWFFRKGCPDATMNCFDISLSRLEVKDPSIQFYECDWMERDIHAPDPSTSLVFFDCHQNQGMRIRQAHERGFRVIMLDDNVPADTIYYDGNPALPSVQMIMDPEITDGTKLDWSFGGKPQSYTYRDADTHGAEELIESWVRLPNVAWRCGYPGLSYLSFVRLRD